MLAVDQLAINFHVKDAALAFDKLSINTICTLNCGRQTGGLGSVVSHHAERDFDIHRNPPVLEQHVDGSASWKTRIADRNVSFAATSQRKPL